MKTVNITEAKSRLSELIALVERGEEEVITRRGSPVARIRAAAAPSVPLDIEALRKAIGLQSAGRGPSSATLVRRMRESRY